MASIQLPPSTDVNDFLTEQEPSYNWLIPGIMERGDRLILTGGEGKGKSTLLRQIAVQCSMGLHPFTGEDMPALRVAYIDLENPRAHLRREIAKLKRNLPIDPYFLSISAWPGGLDLSNLDFRISLTGRLTELKPDLLTVGPMYKMMPHLDTEDASSSLASYLDQLRAGLDLSLILESHQPHQVITSQLKYRPERPFGSSLWMRWPEFGIGLRRPDPNSDDHDTYQLEHWRGPRDFRVWPSHLLKGGTWPWTPKMPTGTFNNQGKP